MIYPYAQIVPQLDHLGVLENTQAEGTLDVQVIRQLVD